ncbi:MAG: hypothetical protein ACLGIS_14515 [Actinomycetes bacterium]
MSAPVTINQHDALRLAAEVLGRTNDSPAQAIALLVHALAGVLAMSIRPEKLDGAMQGDFFGPVLAEAVPEMARLVADTEAATLSALAAAKPAGRA